MLGESNCDWPRDSYGFIYSSESKLKSLSIEKDMICKFNFIPYKPIKNRNILWSMYQRPETTQKKKINEACFASYFCSLAL